MSPEPERWHMFWTLGLKNQGSMRREHIIEITLSKKSFAPVRTLSSSRNLAEERKPSYLKNNPLSSIYHITFGRKKTPVCQHPWKYELQRCNIGNKILTQLSLWQASPLRWHPCREILQNGGDSIFLEEENVLLLFILDPVHRTTWLWCPTCCWCCTWWACCPCPRTRPGCRLARRQRSSPTQTSEGSPMSWSMKSSVSKTHDNKLTVNLYLVAGPGIPNNQLSVQRPADLLIVVKIKITHFFSHVTTTLTSLYKICVSKSIWCQRWDPPHVCCHHWSDNRSPENRFHPAIYFCWIFQLNMIALYWTLLMCPFSNRFADIFPGLGNSK